MMAGGLVAAALALPSVILPAFASGNFAPIAASTKIILDQFTPAGVDSRLAEKFAQRQQAASARVRKSDFQFTPAGLSDKENTITVAARSMTAKAVSVRSSAPSAPAAGRAVSKLKTTNFRLTSADMSAGKGWKDFKISDDKRAAVNAPLITDLGKSSFRLDKGPKKKPSRFNTDIAVAKERRAAPPAQGNAAADDYQLDVGGSFSISRKVDVTAGVRYKSERDDLAPAADNRRDSEAVYVGTKIRF